MIVEAPWRQPASRRVAPPGAAATEPVGSPVGGLARPGPDREQPSSACSGVPPHRTGAGLFLPGERAARRTADTARRRRAASDEQCCGGPPADPPRRLAATGKAVASSSMGRSPGVGHTCGIAGAQHRAEAVTQRLSPGWRDAVGLVGARGPHRHAGEPLEPRLACRRRSSQLIGLPPDRGRTVYDFSDRSTGEDPRRRRRGDRARDGSRPRYAR